MRLLLLLLAPARAALVEVRREDSAPRGRCSGSDGLDMHAYFGPGPLPVLDLRPSIEARGHGIFDLDRARLQENKK